MKIVKTCSICGKKLPGGQVRIKDTSNAHCGLCHFEKMNNLKEKLPMKSVLSSNLEVWK